MEPRPRSDWHEELEGLPDSENLDENRQKQPLEQSRSPRQYGGSLVIIEFRLLFLKGLVFVFATVTLVQVIKNLSVKVSRGCNKLWKESSSGGH